MKHLQGGEFYGETNKLIRLNGLILTDTEYTHDKVDWHYHQHVYFTFILQGKVIEGNKQEVYNCSAGSLLYHNWQEPHYNIKPEGFTRGFHIELKDSWFKHFSLNDSALQGSFNIKDPDAKFLMYKIFKETVCWDDVSAVGIESYLLQLLALLDNTGSGQDRNPLWVHKIREILHSGLFKNYTLHQLAGLAGIHPVHLSRYFPKYFHCGVGEYIRKWRVEQSLALLSSKKMALTDVALECGFSDQSHFIRCFKNIMGITPLSYKKLINS